MVKTVYYRETNPETGKQKWVRIQGILFSGGRGGLLSVDLTDFEEYTPMFSLPRQVVYKSISARGPSFLRTVEKDPDSEIKKFNFAVNKYKRPKKWEQKENVNHVDVD